MKVEIYLGLLKNIEISLILCFLYQISSFFEHRFGRFKSIVNGLIIGTMGIFIMSYSQNQGIWMFDTRTILLASTALFFSNMTLVIVSAIMIGCQLYLGGIGMTSGIAIIILTSAIGWLWRNHLINVKFLSKWVNIYLYALLIHVVMIFALFLLPYSVALETVNNLGLPLLVIYPIVTFLISSIMLIQSKQNQILTLFRNAEHKYKMFFKNQNQPILLSDPLNGRIIDANLAAVKFYGWTYDAFLQKKYSDLVVSNSKSISSSGKGLKSKMVGPGFKHQRSNGEIVNVEELSIPVFFEERYLLMTMIFDVSSKADDESEVNSDMELFHTLVDNSLDAIFIQVQRRFVYINPAALRLFKATDESMLIGHRILDRIHPDYHEEVNHVMSRTTHDRKSVSSSQWIFLTVNNKVVTVETVAVPINYKGQKGTLVITHDITTRLETLSALLNSEMNFRSVVKNMPIPVIIYQKGRIVFFNRAGLKFLGAAKEDDLIGLPFRNFIADSDWKDFNQSFQDLILNKVEISIARQPFVRMDGTKIFAQVGGVEINYDGSDCVLVFMRDLTEELELERRKVEWEMQIQQKQRLESIGILAGGVAHEINNPINGIMNYAQLIIDESQQEDIIDDYVNQILKESHRISDIVKNLLQFSRHEKYAYSYSSIYDIIENTLQLIKVVFKNDQIDLRLTAEENLPDIKCRSQQIQQVFMNMMTNARDALNEKYPGFHEMKIIEVHVSLKIENDQRWIYLTVKDYGMGMSDEVKARIFEPFFSTKPKHIGTGLGLAISFGIVEDHHGKIMVDSVIGEYTTFTIALPADNGWDLMPERRDVYDPYFDR